MKRPKIVCICGTRPDAIKTAPVVVELRKYADQVDTVLLSTGQHREMLAQALSAFDLTPDGDLAIMSHGQTLAEITSRALEGIAKCLDAEKPDWVLAQGDTTTTFVAALSAFYAQIPFGHIEAGLRTDTVHDPFPEEFNRRAAGQLAALHFAPTGLSADNLRREGVPEDNISVTGNTGIDALQTMVKQPGTPWFPDETRRIVLLTTHRRENWGDPQVQIARGFRDILEAFPDTLGVVPMHRNPKVREVLEAELKDHPRVRLIEPPDYADFVRLLPRVHLILTDSGGVQEEAPSFGKPVLVLRLTTERPEGVSSGVARLIGTERSTLLQEASELLGDPAKYQAMAQVASPYGDGLASARIRFALLNRLGIVSAPVTPWS